MNPWSARLLWALGTIVLAGATSYLVSHSAHDSHSHASHAGDSEEDFHHWMHDQLKITPQQEQALEPYEKAFEADRQRLRAEIAEAGRELAAAVRAGKPGSPEIEASLKQLGAAQMGLQRASLDHFFKMKEHLDPEQAEKLLQWTHDSILHQ